jgi:hypothetical protein
MNYPISGNLNRKIGINEAPLLITDIKRISKLFQRFKSNDMLE